MITGYVTDDLSVLHVSLRRWQARLSFPTDVITRYIISNLYSRHFLHPVVATLLFYHPSELNCAVSVLHVSLQSRQAGCVPLLSLVASHPDAHARSLITCLHTFAFFTLPAFWIFNFNFYSGDMLPEVQNRCLWKSNFLWQQKLRLLGRYL